MEASLMPYCQGAIVLYKPSYDADTASKYNLYTMHPVMIATKNFSETTFEYMAFPITSKIEKFCGFRILINSMAAGDMSGKMSVIRTDVMQRVDRRDLYSIFGYAPPGLLEKCLKAFAWHIGLTNEVPEYVTADARRVEYLMAGNPNIVHENSRIEGDIACHAFRMDPATGMPKMFPTREFKTGGPMKPGKPIITSHMKEPDGGPAPEDTDNQPIIGNLGRAMLDAAKKVVSDDLIESSDTQCRATTTTTETETSAPAEGGSATDQTEAESAVEKKAEPAKKFGKNEEKRSIREEMDAVILPDPINADSTATIVQRFIRRSRLSVSESKIELDKDMISRVKAISIDARKEIYTGCMTEIAMQSKFKLSKYSAHKLRLAIVKYITTGIERLGQDMRKFQKDCKFLLNDEDILMFRCMLPHEMRHARVALNFYSELVESKYDLNFEKDTVTGMIQAELKRGGKPMPNF